MITMSSRSKVEFTIMLLHTVAIGIWMVSLFLINNLTK